MGEPGESYPWRWSIYRWIEGDMAAIAPIADLCEFATHLAHFLIALQHIDTTDGPLPSQHSFSCIGGLATYDDETRRAIAALKDKIDVNAATELWERALETTWEKDRQCGFMAMSALATYLYKQESCALSLILEDLQSAIPLMISLSLGNFSKAKAGKPFENGFL